MNRLKQLSVGKQVLLMFGMLCAILLIIGGLFLFSLRSSERSNYLQLRALYKLSLIDDRARDVGQMQADVLRHVLSAEVGEIQRLDHIIRDTEQINTKELVAYHTLVDMERERQLYERVMQARKVYWKQTPPVLTISLANQDSEARELINSTQGSAYREFAKAIGELNDYVETEAGETAKAMNRFISAIRIVGDILIGLAILITIGAGFAVAGVARRLKEDNGILQIEVTARKQTERALRESNEKFRQLADNITDAFWIRSPDMREVHYISPAFERIWGRSAESLHANPQQWADAILPEDRERVRAVFATLTGAAPSLSIEYRIARPDGEVRWVHVRGFQVRNAADELIRLTGIVTDITERKRSEAELEKMHRELLEASRRAGMAEVATGVLHNVGNVLNSVNIASFCVADGLRKSKAVNLSKVVALLREHEEDLGEFFSNDPKGRQVPVYLAQLAEHLAGEQAAALKELAGLQMNIDHIKDIVTMQQSYAKVSGVTETLQISDLVEDALRMNAGALTRHDVQVIREYAEVPPITIEKHKVLQVLVNLIRNAKYACDESGRPDKQMTMRVANGNNRIRISISDNGVGIPVENLTRIFSHGFTTRKGGHGFGLHSGALAAKEMGGSLTVRSAGPGQGAAFTLELPFPTGENSHA